MLCLPARRGPGHGPPQIPHPGWNQSAQHDGARALHDRISKVQVLPDFNIPASDGGCPQAAFYLQSCMAVRLTVLGAAGLGQSTPMLSGEAGRPRPCARATARCAYGILWGFGFRCSHWLSDEFLKSSFADPSKFYRSLIGGPFCASQLRATTSTRSGRVPPIMKYRPRVCVRELCLARGLRSNLSTAAGPSLFGGGVRKLG